ncbi:MAG: hypothetical protein WA954_00875 [Parerythrobacter sp.]
MKNIEVTTSADWKVLTAIRPPAFVAEGFMLLEKDHWKAVAAIRCGMDSVEIAAWETNLRNLRDFFRLDDERQCFSEGRFEWTNFLEPQITRGLVHFLNAGPTRLRKARCVAFARAVSACCRPEHRRSFPNNPRRVRVVAEEKRVDILVELDEANDRFGVAIEAKFNHRLTKGQLKKAVEHTREREWNLDRSCFLVVGPYLDRLDCDIMNRNKAWSSVTWWALLRHFESEIAVEGDCAEFRRFRSTIWSQSYV